MQQQQDSRAGPHAAMEREGQIEAEGPFHPFEPGGQHDLQDDEGKGQLGEAAAEIIKEDVFGLEVDRSPPVRKGNRRTIR